MHNRCDVGPGSLQLGLSPDTGVVLEGLTEAEITMAEGLDGSLDTNSLYAAAAAAGVDAERVSELITILNEHHLLVDTDRAWLSSVGGPPRHPRRPDTTAIAIAAAYGLPGDAFDHVAARSTQHVVISGEGDVPYALADLLRVGGIGQVSVGANAVNSLDLELRGHTRPVRDSPGSAGRWISPTPLIWWCWPQWGRSTRTRASRGCAAAYRTSLWSFRLIGFRSAR